MKHIYHNINLKKKKKNVPRMTNHMRKNFFSDFSNIRPTLIQSEIFDKIRKIRFFG